MLTQLLTVKSRLAILPEDTTQDALLTSAIQAVSARFERETNRALARTVNFQQEFDPGDSQIIALCFPMESVAKFEVKETEAAGWQEVSPAPDFLVRARCVLSLAPTLGFQCSDSSVCRVTYTGGYVMPGDPDVAGATRLPADLEQAAVEQAAFWYQTRDHAGVIREWPKGGTYEQFADLDLLPSVRAVLKRYARLRW